MPADKGFSAILAQKDAVTHLMRSFARGRIAQTYLFCGRESVGRMPSAMAFAALLQCPQPVKIDDGLLDACGVCDSCRRIASGGHPDVNVISPDGYEIRIDQVRAMQDAAALKPSMSAWQVFILDPADRLNISSANSLLKILEEAPSHAVFILLSRDTTAVLPTVLSRSEVVRFAVPSHAESRQLIAEKFSMSAELAARCHALSQGRFGLSLKLASVCQSLPELEPGIASSHTAYLVEIEEAGKMLIDKFSSVQSIDEALALAGALDRETFFPLLQARRAFCRDLIMSAGLPPGFALIFSEELVARINHVAADLKKSFDSVLADAKKAYSSALYKEIDGQISSAVDRWSTMQLEELFVCLLNFYSDALKPAVGGDETLLLNLDVKEDIITVAEVDGVALIRSRIMLLEQSCVWLRRYVQPLLIVENVITQIGGTEA